MNIFTTILVQPLFNVLFLLYAIVPGRDFGISIILLTILVRIILWPIVTKQLHSQKLLQQLQPEVAKIRKNSGGDRQKETQMLMELYKERGTNPFSSILPLLVQLPIFFALYAVLRDSVHPDQIAKLSYGFIQHLGPISDIVNHKVDFSPTLFGAIDLTKPFWGLAVLAGLAQFTQAKQLQPKHAPADDQAKLMAGMIYLLPVITIVVGTRLPSALALYWTVTSLVAVFQQYWVLLRDAEEMEEVADEAGVGPSVLTTTEGGEVVEATTGNASASKKKPHAKQSRKKRRKG